VNAEPGELDLTTEPETPSTPAQPVERPYDPSPARERVRGVIALGLTTAVVVLALLIVTLMAVNKLESDDVQTLQLFFTPIVALSGTALGFYFGGRDSKQTQ
jgi:hypothetical protein